MSSAHEGVELNWGADFFLFNHIFFSLSPSFSFVRLQKYTKIQMRNKKEFSFHLMEILWQCELYTKKNNAH